MKIGTLVKSLDCSQLAFMMTDSFNKASENTAEDDFIVFFNDFAPNVIRPLFCTLNISEMWNFSGNLISTCVHTTASMIKAPIAATKYFYVWDLEWIRREIQYKDAIKSFIDPRIELIARSKSHAEAIKNFCNRDVIGIVEDFNIDQIKEIFNNDPRNQ